MLKTLLRYSLITIISYIVALPPAPAYTKALQCCACCKTACQCKCNANNIFDQPSYNSVPSKKADQCNIRKCSGNIPYRLPDTFVFNESAPLLKKKAFLAQQPNAPGENGFLFIFYSPHPNFYKNLFISDSVFLLNSCLLL